MDEGTYWQRVNRIFYMMDVRTAMATDEEIAEALATIKAHKEGTRVIPDGELRHAQKLKDAILHPDTGEKVFAPLRLSFIVPCNLVLDTLMMSARGTTQTILAQWLNQTYNALHYRANRNATAAAEDGWALAQAYAGATASSVAAALSVERWAERAPAGATWAPVARRLGPFAAVAAADVLNVGLMRRKEFTDGVVVRLESGEEVGTSRVAGALAVSACIFGRVAAAAPILTIPPLVMLRLEQRSAFLRRHPLAGTALLMAMVGTTIQVSVPLTFGVFRQTASVQSSFLEEHIQKRAPGREVVYNKGI